MGVELELLLISAKNVLNQTGQCTHPPNPELTAVKKIKTILSNHQQHYFSKYCKGKLTLFRLKCYSHWILTHPKKCNLRWQRKRRSNHNFCHPSIIIVFTKQCQKCCWSVFFTCKQTSQNLCRNPTAIIVSYFVLHSIFHLSISSSFLKTYTGMFKNVDSQWLHLDF